MKKLGLLILLFLSCGCQNNEIAIDKKEYQNYIKNLNQVTTYNYDYPFILNIDLDVISDLEIMYRVIIDNPGEQMNNIKALAIHNLKTTDIFPSIGIFDEPVTLVPYNEETKGIILIGYIDLAKFTNVNIKVYVQYLDQNNNLKEYYYQESLELES